MVETILVYLIFCLYSAFNGVTDGIMYHLKDIESSVKVNEHNFFAIERVLVLLLIGIIDWNLPLPCLLAFSFFHNGGYYTTRNKLNPNIYQKRWFAQSFTSTAFTTSVFTPIFRTVCFIMSILIMLWAILL